MMVLCKYIISGKLINMVNIFNFIRNLKNKADEPELLQSSNINNLVIESTSRCNLKCEMCPRKSFRKDLGDISIELFKSISVYFYRGIVVNLAGWGEPLLHPFLFELIQIAKERGAIIGFTTNATLLDIEISAKLINCGIDFLDFSLDGATKETYENIRHGAKFYGVLDNIKNFTELKRKLKSNAPLTSITFVMMKKNLHELPMVVKLAKDLNVDILNAKNFNVLTNKNDVEQIVFAHNRFNEPDNNFNKIRDKIIADSLSISRDLNINLVISPFETNSYNKCKIASSSLFISHNGEVALCCATGYPVPRLLNKDDLLDSARMIYGNINKSRLDKILRTKEYKKCIEKTVSHIIPFECKGCLLSEGI